MACINYRKLSDTVLYGTPRQNSFRNIWHPVQASRSFVKEAMKT